MRQTTRSILEALADNAAGPFDAAQSMPPAIYHEQEILDLEIDRLFRKEWICIGRTAEIPQPGDYVCRDVIDAPLFAVRQHDLSVRVFANVCAHRASRLLDGDGHVSRISCPYHSWTYGLDGQLIGAPFMDKTRGFKARDQHLRIMPCEVWQGFIYTTLDPHARPIGARLAGLTSQIADYRIADYVPVFAAHETWSTNWKCLVENFMDAYHVHRVHRDSFGRHGTSEDRTHLFDGEDAFSYHYVQESENRKTVFAHPDNTWLAGDDRFRTWLINVFPSHTMQLQPDMLWYLSLLPDGLDKVSIRWGVSIPAEILDGAKVRQAAIDEVMDLLRQVNSEDRPIVENVFRSSGSPAAGQGRLSYLERNVWQFGRYLARMLCH